MYMFLYTYASFKFIAMVIFETIFANYPIQTLFRYSFAQIQQGCVLQNWLLLFLQYCLLFIRSTWITIWKYLGLADQI